ncbi:cytochrome d ubiquinol oxidase subunit II [Tumebacillus lipolyticus]|uniref:Cytochrome d ubiquinol oxidase subunit II n=1 Tax=Tumebacillus lipolyticus TaxID=1280370 RepID=A0ABW5A178_9BACL
MSGPELSISLLWLFLFSYIILASIEFGAGFLLFWARWRKWSREVEEVIERYLSPFWEVTNVFLIAFVVGLVGFFPQSAYVYGTILLLPGSIALILLIIKGTFFAYFHYAKVRKPLPTFLQAITGLLLPMVLVSIIPVSEGGFVTEEGGRLVLLFGEVLKSPLQWSFVLFALLSVLFVSAVFLHFYASRAGSESAQAKFRQVALNTGLPALGAGAFLLLPLADHRPEHFLTLATEYSWLLLLSGFLFVNAYMFLQRGKWPGITFVLVIGQYAAAVAAYGYSHMPYLLYPLLNINDAYVNQTMAKFLTWTLGLGYLVLIPGLLFLAWLFLFSDSYVKGKARNS